MDSSTRFGLPFIMASQAQKHLTHNEALALLEVLVQPVASEFDVMEPPELAIDGTCVIVGSGATGVFSGEDQNLAALIAGAWRFFVPQSGWVIAGAQTNQLRMFDGSVWTSVSGDISQDNLDHIGINATASVGSRLTVSSDATLLYAETDDHRLTINKATPAATASLVYQSGWSGRAEMGLAGNDAFSFKVSADGTNWVEALHIDQTSGHVTTEHRPVVQAPLVDGPTSHTPGDFAGFAAPVLTQGGLTTGSAMTAPALGNVLLVPAQGVYDVTISLNATLLGALSLMRNASDQLASFDGNWTGTTKTIQMRQLVALNAGDEIALRFDDAATLDATSGTLEMIRL